jgi:hypothetical protein
LEEKAAWREGLEAHFHAENEHDVDAILATFADPSEVVWGGRSFRGVDVIRKLHDRMGFGNDGAFTDLQIIERKRHYTSTAIIVEQTLRGRHAGIWEGLAPTGREVQVPVCTVYEFNSEGRIVSERPHLDRWVLWKQLTD